MISVNCNLCGHDEWDVRFPSTTQDNAVPVVDAFRCTHSGYGHHPQIVQCRHCGLVYANPRWSPDELLAAYQDVEDETYVSEREGRELTFARHLAAMEKVVGPADGRTLLDVGAYIGVFVEIAAANGWQATGVEPSRWAAGAAQEQGINVINGTLDSPALTGCQFDVVTMWDVIEHLADPAAELARAAALLKPGGWLVAHTMDVDSAMARIMGPRWPWLMDMHLYYFSRRTLAATLEKAGFEVVWHGAQGRYLSLGYLTTRLHGLSRRLGRSTARVVDSLSVADVAIPVNFGDLITIYGRYRGE